MSYDAGTARTVVEVLQAALDEAIGTRDPGRVVAPFAEEAVLIGSARYNAGHEAVADYLTLVATHSEVLRWHLRHHDVFLASDDVIGFAAEGEVEWADGDGSGRNPFRLTVVARETEDGWRILHFHGSIPEQG